MRVGAGHQRQNRHLRRFFYLLQRLEPSVYLEFVPGDLNPTDCLSRVDSHWHGSVASAYQGAGVRYKALEAYPNLPCPAWVLAFPKGRRMAATDLGDTPMGSAE